MVFKWINRASRIKKATTHVTQNEGLLFEVSRPGRTGYSIPALDVPERAAEELIAKELLRDDDLEGMPELSEVDVIRHFTRISTWNYGVDTGMYPLGSCTMKYNPRINERVARIEGFAALHPLTPAPLAQGALEIIRRLEECLARDHRARGRDDATGGGRAGRADRDNDDPRGAHGSRQPAQKSSDPRLRARDQPGFGCHQRLHGRDGPF